MSINRRNVRGVTVLEPVDRLTSGVGDVALRRAIGDALDSGDRHIVVNLGGVTTIDSSGIGELVNGQSRTMERGGSLRLSNLTSQVRDTLQMAGRLNGFEVYDDEIDAIRSF